MLAGKGEVPADTKAIPAAMIPGWPQIVRRRRQARAPRPIRRDDASGHAQRAADYILCRPHLAGLAGPDCRPRWHASSSPRWSRPSEQGVAPSAFKLKVETSRAASARAGELAHVVKHIEGRSAPIALGLERLVVAYVGTVERKCLLITGE
jgi:hypothetical protein